MGSGAVGFRDLGAAGMLRRMRVRWRFHWHELFTRESNCYASDNGPSLFQ